MQRAGKRFIIINFIDMSRKTWMAVDAFFAFVFLWTGGAFAQTPDVTPPVISAIIVSGIGQSAAQINWTTDEPADARIEYGTSTAYGIASALQTATTTAHAVSLSGLTASTTYHFLVKSGDTAGNLATSSDHMFTTLSAPATTTPPIVGSIAVGVKVEPKTLNARSGGKWFQARVSFPEGYDARDANVASVKLNGVLSPERVKVKKGKHKNRHSDDDRRKERGGGDDDDDEDNRSREDRESRLEMKFSRRAVIHLLESASSTVPLLAEKQIVISGQIAGNAFSGTAVIQFRRMDDFSEGTVVRSSGSPEVFIIKKGKKRHVPSVKAFEELGLKWDNIITVAQVAIDAHPDDVLVKSDASPAVFLLSGGKKRHITDPALFESQGLDWEDVTVLSAKELNHFSSVNAITLLRAKGDAKVYFISGAKRQWILSEAVFHRHGFKWEDIVIVDESERDALQDGGVLQ